MTRPAAVEAFEQARRKALDYEPGTVIHLGDAAVAAEAASHRAEREAQRRRDALAALDRTRQPPPPAHHYTLDGLDSDTETLTDCLAFVRTGKAIRLLPDDFRAFDNFARRTLPTSERMALMESVGRVPLVLTVDTV